LKEAIMPEDDKGGKWKVVEVLLNSPNLILVVGGILVLLGSAGGVTYHQWFPITDRGWRIFVVVLGVPVLGLYFWLPKDSAKKLTDRMIKSLGIKIDYPESNTIITGSTDVRGTIAKPIPKGDELRILRGYPRGGFVPDAYCFCDANKNTWLAQHFDIGGEREATAGESRCGWWGGTDVSSSTHGLPLSKCTAQRTSGSRDFRRPSA
jgi:hypothetical protein